MKNIKYLVILAGGQGTRIKNYLKKKPKPMVKILNKNFLFYLIKHYSKYNFKKIIILAGYRGSVIKKKFHNKYFNFTKIIVKIEKKPRGTAGSLSLLGIRDNFILINGDTFFPINIKKFITLAQEKNIVTAAITKNYKYKSNKKLVGIKIHKNSIVKLNTSSKLMNGGTYVINKKIFTNISRKFQSLENDIIPNLIKKKKVGGLIFNEFFLDIGTPYNLKRAPRLLKNYFNKPAIIFDRDNTLNYDKGYTHKIKEFKLKPFVLKTLKYLNQKKYLIFVVTNQSGIAKKKFTLKKFNKLHKYIKKKLDYHNIYFDDVKFCPFHPEGKIKKFQKNSGYRKPGTLMIKELISDWHFNLKKSLVIGDQISDKIMAERLKINFAYPKKNLLKQIKNIINNYNFY